MGKASVWCAALALTMAVLASGGSRKTPAVVINGRNLSEQQVLALKQTYGARPRPGNYWYDARSGLYGVVGYPAYSFMSPGHDFGPLPANASRGTSGVFVNGRQLPRAEA